MSSLLEQLYTKKWEAHCPCSLQYWAIEIYIKILRLGPVYLGRRSQLLNVIYFRLYPAGKAPDAPAS